MEIFGVPKTLFQIWGIVLMVLGQGIFWLGVISK